MMKGGPQVEALFAADGDGFQRLCRALPFLIGPAVAAVGGNGAGDLKALGGSVAGNDDLGDIELSKQGADALHVLEH